MKKPPYYLVYQNDFACLTALTPYLKHSDISSFVQALSTQRTKFDHSMAVRFEDIFKAVQKFDATTWKNGAIPSFFGDGKLSIKRLAVLEQLLKKLGPWRKGPFDMLDVPVKTEWDCDLKWNRLGLVEDDIKNKVVLDVGSNSGYYLLRVMEHLPKHVVGIDPTLVYYFQFLVLKHFSNESSMHMLSLGFQDLEPLNQVFDTMLCLGILYHHRHPFELLSILKKIGKENQCLVLETLIIDSKEDVCLSPKEAIYAKMPNVYFIPSLSVLKSWLLLAGYKKIEVGEVFVTVPEEQSKQLEWAGEYSGISEGLDASDPSKTIEGYPAPKRVVVRAFS
ncbi:tRNA 5-methoxyuridine(34)/uridine 5-oxyacetic acid(34) synthase CmoB [bacterium]|jgi:tRNA (mo5U34)-methyltransferase|nr:tRNA 5-methoxyuridine(34)/uridine 5-oxyacetic acid(34) synthase CmoB [bacterium]